MKAVADAALDMAAEEVFMEAEDKYAESFKRYVLALKTRIK